MTYTIYDVNGYVGEGPTETAMGVLRRAAMKTTRWSLRHLVQHGWTNDLEALQRQLDNPLPGVSDKMLKELLEYAKVAKEIFIISDGVGGSDDDGE